jgi:serine/threonine protein phosphatase PrpC
VSCEPEFVIHERCAGDEVLLLACDGLWDVLNNDEAINKIREIFANGGNVMTKVAEDMLTYSLEKGTLLNLYLTNLLVSSFLFDFDD